MEDRMFSIEEILKELGIKEEIYTDSDVRTKIDSTIIGILNRSENWDLKYKIREVINGKTSFTEEEKNAIIKEIEGSPIIKVDETREKYQYSGMEIGEDGSVKLQDVSIGHDRVENHNSIVSIGYDKDTGKIYEMENRQVTVSEVREVLGGVTLGIKTATMNAVTNSQNEPVIENHGQSHDDE